MDDLTAHETANRAHWDAQADRYQERHGEQLKTSGGDAWGLWQRPESELNVLGEVAGLDVLEFGCGAAQWSIALARRGAHMTALDLSERQLAHARELMLTATVEFPLVSASAEATPFSDRSFDVVFCDWGAMTFADPYRTVPEAARLLRAGGLFAFCGGTPLVDCTWESGAGHPGERLVVDYFGRRMIAWAWPRTGAPPQASSASRCHAIGSCPRRPRAYIVPSRCRPRSGSCTAGSAS